MENVQTWPASVSAGVHTAKIYRCVTNARWTTYTICWKEGLITRKRSLSDPNAALREAHKIVGHLHDTGGPYTPPPRTLRYYQTQEQKAGKPLDQVVEEYTRLAAAAAPGTVTLAHAAEEYFTHTRSTGVCSQYIASLGSYLGPIISNPALKNRSLSSITTKDLDDAIQARWENNRTRNNCRTSLTSFFAWARDHQGYLPKGQPTVAQALPKRQIEIKEPEIYSPEELQKILKEATPEAIPFLVISAFAGIRLGEIKRMLWENIDWATGSIPLQSATTKTRRRRVVPMTENLIAWLQAHRKESGPIIPVANPHTLLRGVTVERRHNGLRHSFVSYHLALNQQSYLTAEISGNSPRIMESNYKSIRLADGRYVTRELAQEWFSIKPEILVA
jgi:integrase